MMRKDHTTTTKKRNPKLLVLLSSPAAFLVAIVTIILIYSSLLEAKQDEQRNEEIINSTSIINAIGGAGRKSQNHITCGSCSSGADHYAGARTGVVVLCSGAAQSSSEAISSKCLGQEDVGAVVPTTSYQGVCCCSDNVEPPLGEASIAWCSQERATFCEAKAMCGRNGARLCTKQEALNECTTGTGCGFLDGNMVWTCDKAPPKQIGKKYEEEQNKKVVGARAGGISDIHFMPFKAAPFNYNGQCDVVMMASKQFANGLGIRLHARTTRVHNLSRQQSYSYISAIALMIGTDIVEVQEDGSIFINENDDSTRKKNKTILKDENNKRTRRLLNKETFAGFEIIKTALNNGSTNNNNNNNNNILIYKLNFENGSSIGIQCNTKKRIISVFLFGTFPHDTAGLLGNPYHDTIVAREGNHMIALRNNQHNTNEETARSNTLGNEWQVRADEPKLFQDKNRFPQHPVGCVHADDEQEAVDITKSYLRQRRHLMDSSLPAEEENDTISAAVSTSSGTTRNRNNHVSLMIAEAEKACAHARDATKRKFCIDDVLATKDLDLASDEFYT